MCFLVVVFFFTKTPAVNFVLDTVVFVVVVVVCFVFLVLLLFWGVRCCWVFCLFVLFFRSENSFP